MKTFHWIAFVYATLFGIVVAVNESTRPRIAAHSFGFDDQHTLHGREAKKRSCTWECHFNTGWCKDNHVKLDRKWLEFTDIPYFGIIDSLKSMGNYTLANILFLVLLIPTTILWMLVRSMEMEWSIRKLDRKR